MYASFTVRILINFDSLGLILCTDKHEHPMYVRADFEFHLLFSKRRVSVCEKDFLERKKTTTTDSFRKIGHLSVKNICVIKYMTV